MNRLITIALVCVGVIHLLPVAGVLGVEKLNTLYGLQLGSQQHDLALLMRHRAMLLGLVGLILLFGAFNSAMQLLCVSVGLLSITSFIVLSWMVTDINASLQCVVLIDWFALALLLVALVLILLRK